MMDLGWTIRSERSMIVLLALVVDLIADRLLLRDAQEPSAGDAASVRSGEPAKPSGHEFAN
jgi:hypothetical protein